MQAVNQLSQPTGSINPNTRFSQKVKSTSRVNSSAIISVVVYLVIAVSLISLSYMDNGYLLTETISGMGVVGLLLVIKFLGKDTLETSKSTLKN